MKLAICSIIACALIVSPAFAQRNLDPSSCYSNLLQRTELYNHSEHLKYALLSIIDASNFESFRANGSLTAMFSDIPFNLGFAAFHEARQKYYEQHNINLEYENATISSEIGLDPRASELFETCIRGLANSQYGVSIFASSEDENIGTVQIFWKPTKAGDAVLITGSEVENGTVRGTGEGKLFATATLIKDSKTRIIKRSNPNKPIIITLDTLPDVTIGRIVIAPVPPRVSCEKKTVDRDPVTNQPFVSDKVVVADNFVDGKGGPNGSEFAINEIVDGNITSVSCEKAGPARDFIELYSNSGNIIGGSTGQCLGSKNGERRLIHMVVRWQKTFTQCTSIPWQTEQEAKQATRASK
jgi:hypothetical protein